MFFEGRVFQREIGERNKTEKKYETYSLNIILNFFSSFQNHNAQKFISLYL